MLGSPNVTLGGGTLTYPAAMTFRPLPKAGAYIWDGATADQPFWFLTKSTPTPTRHRYSYECKQQINSAVAGQPDANLRVYMVIEADVSSVITDTVISNAVGWVAFAASSSTIRSASQRGEV